MRKNVVPAAKRVGAELLEVSASEIAEVVSGRNSSRKQQRVGKNKL